MLDVKNYINLLSEEYDKKFTFSEEEIKTSNRVTVMEVAKKQLNKNFFVNEKNEIDVKATFPLYFELKEVAINNIKNIAHLISDHRDMQNRCFTRAKPTDYAQYTRYYKNARVKKRTEETLAENGRTLFSTLKDSPRNWLMIDVDYYTTDYSLATKENREIAINSFINELPECFQNTSFCVQYSNGMLVRDDTTLKAHIFFMTEQSLMSEQLKPWIKKRAKQADPCTFNTAQIYFIADPYFTGIQDPFNESSRVVLFNKKNKKINLPLKQIKEDYIYNMLSNVILKKESEQIIWD